MRVVSTARDYTRIGTCIDNLLDDQKTLPANVFNGTLRNFLFVTFDELFMDLFFNHLQHYLARIGESTFWLSVLDPDPISYFAAHFHFFGAFEFVDSDNDHDYLSALNDYPGESPADAVAHNSNALILSSYSTEWAVYGNRDADIAICAFSSQSGKQSFHDAYGDDLLNGVLAAAEYAYGARADRNSFEEFCNSYANND